MIHCSSLHLDEDVSVGAQVLTDGTLSLHFMTLSNGKPHMSSFFDLHGDVEQMERVVAALEQGLMEVLRQGVNEDLEVAFPDQLKADLQSLPEGRA